MPSPSSARHRYAQHIVGTGHVWTLGMDNSNASETGDEEVQRLGAPLYIFMTTSETRVINGNTVGPFSAGLHSFTDTGATRWARALSATTGPFYPFEPVSWVDSLPDRSWGGTSLTFRTWDDDGADASLWVRGRSISVRVREYEDGVLTSDGELFSGFITVAEREDEPFSSGSRYTVTAVTIEAFLRQEGMDTDAQQFVDDTYAGASDVQDPLLGPQAAPTNLPATHQFQPLTLAAVIRHLMRFHVKVRINGADYALAEVCDLVTDDATANDDTIDSLTLPPGNLMDGILGFLPYGLRQAYSFRDSAIVVTSTFEAGNPQAAIDSITEAECYKLRRLPGLNNTVKSVTVKQAAAAMASGQTEALTATVTTGASVGKEIVLDGYWFTTEANGEFIGQAAIDRLNSEDRIEFELAGAPFGIFNKVTFTDDYVVERVMHAADVANYGPHETTTLARKLA